MTLGGRRDMELNMRPNTVTTIVNAALTVQAWFWSSYPPGVSWNMKEGNR